MLGLEIDTRPKWRMTFKEPARPAGSRCVAPLPAPLFRRRNCAVKGGKTAVKPLQRASSRLGGQWNCHVTEGSMPI
jgi:hypothetical protein